MARGMNLKVGCGADKIQWPPLGLLEALANVKSNDAGKEYLNPPDHEHGDDQACPASDAASPDQDASDNDEAGNE